MTLAVDDDWVEITSTDAGVTFPAHDPTAGDIPEEDDPMKLWIDALIAAVGA